MRTHHRLLFGLPPGSSPRPHRGRHARRSSLALEALEPRHAFSATPLAAPAMAGPAVAAAMQPAVDLNADGICDAVWRDTVTGLHVAWLYDSSGAVASSRLLGGDADWSLDDLGDYNGDAVTDLAWRSVTGSTVMWLMQADGGVSAEGFIGGDATWRLEASGDYDGDSRTDVVWRDAASGLSVMCLMNGLTPTLQQAIGGSDVWRLASTAPDYDSNADGKTDLIWTSTSGAKVLHRMNGATVLSAAVLGSDTAADLAGTGDFNGDGKHDLLWRNTLRTMVPGIVVGWLMDDGTVVSSYVLGGDLSWAVATTVDVTGDGTTDIIWRDSTTGGTVAWIMSGFVAIDHQVLGGDAIWSLVRRPGVHPA